MAQHSASFSRNHQAFLPQPAEWPPSFICCPPGEQPSALPHSDLIVQLRMTCFHLQRPPGSAHLTLAVSLCAGSKAGVLVFLLELSGSYLSLLLAVVAAAARRGNVAGCYGQDQRMEKMERMMESKCQLRSGHTEKHIQTVSISCC